VRDAVSTYAIIVNAPTTVVTAHGLPTCPDAWPLATPPEETLQKCGKPSSCNLEIMRERESLGVGADEVDEGEGGEVLGR